MLPNQGMEGSSVRWKVLSQAPLLGLRDSHFCLPDSGTMMGEVPPATSVFTMSAPNIWTTKRAAASTKQIAERGIKPASGSFSS